MGQWKIVVIEYIGGLKKYITNYDFKSRALNLCTYKLGSGDDEMTMLAQNLPAHGARTYIWMENGSR